MKVLYDFRHSVHPFLGETKVIVEALHQGASRALAWEEMTIIRERLQYRLIISLK